MASFKFSLSRTSAGGLSTGWEGSNCVSVVEQHGFPAGILAKDGRNEYERLEKL
ncbi:MAG: hypothetical protein ONA90_04290 [candidate division KSB1 bacterium]|nr:hypothetical protein [candidate division KSB1 bacterium]